MNKLGEKIAALQDRRATIWARILYKNGSPAELARYEQESDRIDAELRRLEAML